MSTQATAVLFIDFLPSRTPGPSGPDPGAPRYPRSLFWSSWSAMNKDAEGAKGGIPRVMEWPGASPAPSLIGENFAAHVK